MSILKLLICDRSIKVVVQTLVSIFGPVQSWTFDPNGRFVLDLKTSDNEQFVGHWDH